MSSVSVRYCQNNLNNKGILFFNIGKGCILRLIVSIYSLRKYYTGVVGVLLCEDDECSDIVIEALKPFNVETYWFKRTLNLKRNTGYTIKPEVLSQSPYGLTLFCDSDTIFTCSPECLFKVIDENDLILTSYRDWKTTGSRIAKRIKSLRDILPPEQIQKSLEYGTAINTGVVGYRRSVLEEFFQEWVETTLKGSGRFIIDEIACQCIAYKYKHKLIETVWNYSCREKNMNDAKIIHYHGRKHARPDRYASGFIWLDTLDELEKTGIVDADHLKTFAKWDRYVRRYREKNG